MCQAPNQLPDGTFVACRNCTQCKARKVTDWVGRCIAESKTALASHSVTLTYGRDENDEADHIRAAVLTYSDVQKWFKRLRRRRLVDGKWVTYPCRYFVCGEYGSTKGRAHWHAIIYWLERVPPLELEANIVQAEWEHGHSFWKALDDGYAVSTAQAVRYVCKYLQKDADDLEAQGLLRMSKKPPLGAAWFRQLAQRYIDQGVSPQTLHYQHPGVDDRHGQPVKFYLHPASASASIFLEAYVAGWVERYGDMPPRSDPVWHHLEATGVPPWSWATFKEKPKAFLGFMRRKEWGGKHGKA